MPLFLIPFLRAVLYPLRPSSAWQARSSLSLSLFPQPRFEIYRAISQATRSSRPIKVTGDLKSKIAYWRFLHSWRGYLLCMAERHLVVEVSSDASQYAWGGIIHNPDGLRLDCREFWRRFQRAAHRGQRSSGTCQHYKGSEIYSH